MHHHQGLLAQKRRHEDFAQKLDLIGAYVQADQPSKSNHPRRGMIHANVDADSSIASRAFGSPSANLTNLPSAPSNEQPMESHSIPEPRPLASVAPASVPLVPTQGLVATPFGNTVSRNGNYPPGIFPLSIGTFERDEQLTAIAVLESKFPAQRLTRHRAAAKNGFLTTASGSLPLTFTRQILE
ncbi:hypothetical protein HGRIS_001220 [Hohenbuehelia grisea]|uniref:Uncharacterized protein n=1 Tax=Hohenbuehelia grisea TaxID=104357 RepID=A0ABR3JNU6_9AGAR